MVLCVPNSHQVMLQQKGQGWLLPRLRHLARVSEMVTLAGVPPFAPLMNAQPLSWADTPDGLL
jgi:hypothetical protein